MLAAVASAARNRGKPDVPANVRNVVVSGRAALSRECRGANVFFVEEPVSAIAR